MSTLEAGLPSETSRPRMWPHACGVQGNLMIGAGEDCPWCGAVEETALLTDAPANQRDGSPRREMGVDRAGVLDPDYARVFTKARCLAWQEGYALLAHGTLTRDLDLLAVPWADAACEPEHLVRRIVEATDLKIAGTGYAHKPHGRMAWTLLFKEFGDPRFVDLSIMPRALQPTAAAKPQSEGEREEAERDLDDAVMPGGFN